MGAAIDLGIVVVALFAIILDAAGLSNLPVIGNVFQRWADRARPRWQALEQIFHFPIYQLSRWFSAAINIFDMLTFYVPDRIENLIDRTKQKIEHDYRHLGDYIEVWARGQIAGVISRIALATTTIRTWTSNQLVQITHDYKHLGDYIEVWARGEFARLEHGYKHLGNYVEVWAQGQFNVLSGAIQNAYNRLESTFNPRVRQLEQQLANQTEIGNIRYKDLLKELNDTDLSLEQKIAAVSAIAEGVTAALDDLKKNCTNRLCFNLGDLARTVNDLNSDVTFVALLALVGAAMRSPVDTAKSVEGRVVGPIQEVSEFIRTL